MSDKPGREQLSGYVMRDYEQLVATLAASGAECRARRLFALADALGYDLALIPKDDA